MSALPIGEILAPVREGLAAVEARLREVVAGQHAALTVATERLLAAGGKRIRPGIVLLVAGIFSADPARAIALAAGVEMLHTATLVHDDLIDGSPLRRGIPTLNADWPPAATVLTGDYLFARAAGLVAQTEDSHIQYLFARTLMTIVNGEIGQQFSCHSQVGRAAYYERIFAKTGALFVLSAEAAAWLGQADEAGLEALRAFGREVGMAYQVVDDILDFTPEQTGKPGGYDLRQGLVTLPAICYGEAHPDDPRLADLLRGNGTPVEDIAGLVATVRASGALDAAAREARHLAARGRQALERLPGSAYVDALAALCDYIVDRRY